MSYWLGKHGVGESPLGISTKHQAAISNEPEGATFGYLVECRCGWQSRVPRFIPEDKVKEVCEGTAQNHFNQHLMESINKEIIWQNFSLPSEQELKKQDQLSEQRVGPSSVDSSEASQVPSLVPNLVVPQVEQAPKSSKPKNLKEVASPSQPPTETLQTPPVTTPATLSPSTVSQESNTANSGPTSTLTPTPETKSATPTTQGDSK